MGLINKIALSLYHSRRECDPPSRVPGTVFWVPFTLIALLFVLQMGTAVFRWSRYSPKVEIEPQRWSILYEDSEKDCSLDATVAHECPAHNENTELWSSSLHPRTKEGDEAILQHPSQRFWIGAEVPADQVQKANTAGADILLLGWIKGDYQIWVNGRYFSHGDAQDLDPIAVTIPHSTFLDPGSMKIAVRIAPKYGVYDPAAFAGQMPVGLADPTSANAYRNFFSFGKKVRPFAIFVLFFFVSVTFYQLWVSDRKKREYFHFSMYNLASALGALTASDLFLQILPLKISFRFILGLSLTQGILGATMGLAFARCRLTLIRAVLVLGAIGVLLVLDFPFASQLMGRGGLGKMAWVVAFLHIIGAVACLIQVVHLRDLGKLGIDHSSRIRKLVWFSAALISISALCGLESVSYTTTMLFSQFLQVALVAVLGGAVLFDYKRERELIEKIPVSNYHRLPELPQSLSGVILYVDLKDSEALTRLSLSRSRSSNELVSICLSRIWEEVIEAKGTILATEGDMVSAFFDSSKFENANAAALRATDGIRLALNSLRVRLIEQGLLPTENGPLNFRGAITSGCIRPVWLETGVMRMAAWEQVGNSTPFLKAARFLDLERGASEGKAVSLVITEEPLHQEMVQRSLSGDVLFSNRPLSGKHGVSYIVSGYTPGLSRVIRVAAA